MNLLQVKQLELLAIEEHLGITPDKLETVTTENANIFYFNEKVLAYSLLFDDFHEVTRYYQVGHDQKSHKPVLYSACLK